LTRRRRSRQRVKGGVPGVASRRWNGL